MWHKVTFPFIFYDPYSDINNNQAYSLVIVDSTSYPNYKTKN